MEQQDVTYSTVVFKNEHPPPQSKVSKEEQTIYSEVVITSSAAAPDTAGDKKPDPLKDAYVQTTIIVTLCVLLLVSIAVLIYLAISMANQSSENQRLSSEMSLLQNNSEQLQQKMDRLQVHSSELENRTLNLTRENSDLQNLTQELRRQRDSLNNTLQLALIYKCKQCLDGWVLFENSCYFFYNALSWKTWDDSRTYCKQLNQISDLVVINSRQEQEFIHRNIKFYYDNFHGFWIGLSVGANSSSWVWVDGQTDTLSYWMTSDLGSRGPKALVIPNQTVTNSWDPAENIMLNKFICEGKALVIV